MEDADWDLQAVVRGCCSAVSTSSATTSSATTTTTATTPSWPENAYIQSKSTFHEENLAFFPYIFQPRTDNSIEHFLNDLYNPIYFQNIHNTPPSPQNLPISPLSVLGELQDPPFHHHNQHHQQQQQQQEKHFHGKQQSLGVSRCTTSNAQSTTNFKKRKNQIKKVCQLPVEGSPPSSDLWSWRKYGQKPIKGSPFPRGYYKCSTSKGCLARKQVERNRSEPGMLIITYTGEHSHPMPAQRNSLGGSSRYKTTTSGEDDNINKPTPSSPFSPIDTLSPAMEMIDEFEFEFELDRDYTDDDNLDVSGIVIDEDIFDGLDDFVGPATGDMISGRS